MKITSVRGHSFVAARRLSRHAPESSHTLRLQKQANGPAGITTSVRFPFLTNTLFFSQLAVSCTSSFSFTSHKLNDQNAHLSKPVSKDMAQPSDPADDAARDAISQTLMSNCDPKPHTEAILGRDTEPEDIMRKKLYYQELETIKREWPLMSRTTPVTTVEIPQNTQTTSASGEEEATSKEPETVILVDDNDEDSPGEPHMHLPDSQCRTDRLKPNNKPGQLQWRYFILENDRQSSSAGKWPGPTVPDDMRFDLEQFRKDYGWTSTNPGELGNFAGEFQAARRDFYHSKHDQEDMILADAEDPPEVTEGWGLSKPTSSSYLHQEKYTGPCQLYKGFPMVENVTFVAHENLSNSISGGCCYWTALALLLYGDAEQWLRVKADHLAHFGRVLVNEEHPRYELYTKLNSKMYNVRAGYPANHKENEELLPTFCANLWMVLKLPGVYVPMQMLDITADLYEAYITVYSMGLEEEEEENKVKEVRTRGAYNGRHLAMMYADGNHFRPMVPNEFLSWEFKFPRITQESTKGLPYKVGKADGVKHPWRSEFADNKLRGQKAPVIIERGFQPAAAYWAVGLVPPPKDDVRDDDGDDGGPGGGGSGGQDGGDEGGGGDGGDDGGTKKPFFCDHWDEHCNIEAERNDLEDENEQLKAELDQLRGEYEEQKSNWTFQSGAVKDKSEEALEEARTQADALREELRQSGSEVSNLRQQVTNLQDQLQRLPHQLGEARRDRSEGPASQGSEPIRGPPSPQAPPALPEPRSPTGPPSPPPPPGSPPPVIPPPAPAAKTRNRACTECKRAKIRCAYEATVGLPCERCVKRGLVCRFPDSTADTGGRGGGAAGSGDGPSAKGGKTGAGRGGGTTARGGKAAKGRGKAKAKTSGATGDEVDDNEEADMDKTDTEATEANGTKTKKTATKKTAPKKAAAKKTAAKKPAAKKAPAETETTTGARTSSRLRTVSLAEATETIEPPPEAGPTQPMEEDDHVGHGGPENGEGNAPAELGPDQAPTDSAEEDEAETQRRRNSLIRKLSSYSDESEESSSPNKRRRSN